MPTLKKTSATSARRNNSGCFPSSFPGEPRAATTCAPGVTHESAGSMRPSWACPPAGVHVAHFGPMCLTTHPADRLEGTACATLRARVVPHAPYVTRRVVGPRGAGGASRPLGRTRARGCARPARRAIHSDFYYIFFFLSARDRAFLSVCWCSPLAATLSLTATWFNK